MSKIPIRSCRFVCGVILPLYTSDYNPLDNNDHELPLYMIMILNFSCVGVIMTHYWPLIAPEKMRGWYTWFFIDSPILHSSLWRVAWASLKFRCLVPKIKSCRKLDGLKYVEIVSKSPSMFVAWMLILMVWYHENTRSEKWKHTETQKMTHGFLHRLSTQHDFFRQVT